MKKMYQPYYLVSISPWPILMSLNLFFMFMMMLNWIYSKNFFLLMFSMFMLMMNFYQWWRDIIRESTYQGLHTKKIMSNLKFGMILFIISEIFFFLSIFWCYLHMFLSPSIEIGMIWPPKNIVMFNPYDIPLLNTIILLSSGFTITWTHYLLLKNYKLYSFIMLLMTIILGLIFTYIQYLEYYHAKFTLSDSVFGSIFFFSTGFHGLHVLIGTMFLLVSLFRIMMNNYSLIHHVGFELSAWYWHFVDVVWLFLFILVYVYSY